MKPVARILRLDRGGWNETRFEPALGKLARRHGTKRLRDEPRTESANPNRRQVRNRWPRPDQPFRHSSDVDDADWWPPWPHPGRKVGDESDRADMARLVNGDDLALDSLLLRRGNWLLRHLNRIVHSHADARNLMIETFLRVFQHRQGFCPEWRFTTWLFAIGSRLAIDLLRWRGRHPEFVSLAEDTEECLGSILDPAPNPREQAESDEWTDALEQALDRLPERLRAPLLSVALDGCSQAEVAARSGCTVKTVEMRVYHGRKRLRLELERLLDLWPPRAQQSPPH